MKPQKLYDLLGEINDSLILRAQKSRKNKKYIRYISIAACLVLVITAVSVYAHFKPEGTILPTANALATAVYPQEVKYPIEEDYLNENGEVDYNAYSEAYSVWHDEWRKKNTLEVTDDGINDYVKNTLSVLAKDNGENLVYSPANIYFALSMLSECTDGQTQAEILNVLGYDDIEVLRKNTNNLWQKLYADNGVYSSVFANSIWLKDGINYNSDTLNILKDSYYASVFSGDFSNEGYLASVKDWINQNTKGLLKDQTETIEFNDATMAALVSTIYFNAKWNSKFGEEFTEKGDFFGTDGKVSADFMKSSHSQAYYYADGYSATTLRFEQDSSMHFILPDENVSVYDIIGKDGVLDIITNRAATYEYDGEAKKAYPIVNLSVPRFDVSKNIDLIDTFKSLGINTAFDKSNADFSPLTTDLPLFLSKAQHAARVKIDEEGCEAAAYTIMAKDAGSAPPDSVVDMVLDRPFIFVISGKNDLPRFIGIVNNP